MTQFKYLSFIFFFFNKFFYFRIVWDSKKICKDSTEHPHPPHQRPLLAASCVTVVRLSQLTSQQWLTIVSQTPCFTRVSFVFPGAFSRFQDLLQETTFHSAVMFCRLLYTGFLRFSCFGWPWQFWGALIRPLVECPSTWACLVFFLMVRPRLLV